LISLCWCGSYRFGEVRCAWTTSN